MIKFDPMGRQFTTAGMGFYEAAATGGALDSRANFARVRHIYPIAGHCIGVFAENRLPYEALTINVCGFGATRMRLGGIPTQSVEQVDATGRGNWCAWE